MNKFFNIYLEFDRIVLEKVLLDAALTKKGYCCFIDHTLLVTANRQKDKKLETILNNSLINFCDGSYIALMASSIYKKEFKAYNGPELFNKYIFYPARHCIVGNTEEVYNKIIQKLSDSGVDTSNYLFVPLPYKTVEQFDYKSIGDTLNKFDAQFIWVSLGAPKQEEFMSRMLPYLNKGVMLGIGAALNYFSGEIKDIPEWIKKIHLIWLYRVFTEPKKQIPRCWNTFKTYPVLYFREKSKKTTV